MRCHDAMMPCCYLLWMFSIATSKARWEEVEREEQSPDVRAEAKYLDDAPSMLSVLQEERARLKIHSLHQFWC